jgi:alginate O-acetyltransferase complex protein AlgI
MSLSSWFRDYLFIPLGGSRRGVSRTVLNLFVTMFLAGLWHGAAWTFVIWGLLHGVFLAAHAVLRKVGLTPPWLWLNRTLTFLLVCALFVIFRSPSLGVAGDVLSSMAGLNGLDSSTALNALIPLRFALLLGALLVFVNLAPNTWQIHIKPRVWYGTATGIGAALAVMTISQPHPFIYFQF